ncbi:MAG: hypothetical protein J5676_13995 [Bacteroidaceae bacterium]|nr:hypothetical protein [Bacteroidaceae bacterium]
MNGINRLVLIGNGFDLAHGLKTSYKDFISWYWSGVLDQLKNCNKSRWSDELCTFECSEHFYLSEIFDNCSCVGDNAYEKINTNIGKIKRRTELVFRESLLIQNICKSIETKGWADIEYEYYELLKEYSLNKPDEGNLKSLNKQLRCLEGLLVEYLGEIDGWKLEFNEEIKKKIYVPIDIVDISVDRLRMIEKYRESCLCEAQESYPNFDDLEDSIYRMYYVNSEKFSRSRRNKSDIMEADSIMLLSFNYTKTASLYIPEKEEYFTVNYIHGKLDNPESVIFGYGDELDEKYKQLQESNDNECLKNVKSIKYLEADNYRKVLQFIESAPFQVCIMGHSCGNSDRTLLNTIFEHENCISIKPYYHKRSDGSDNYIEIVQNISRNFKDPKLMRDRVVNKYYCEPLT